MTRSPFLLLSAFCVTLSACAGVEDTQRTTITVDGEAYELRSRTLSGPDGRFETTSVRVGSIYYPCIKDSPGDCAGTVRYALGRFENWD